MTCRGVCDMPHVSVSWHNLAEGHASLFPSVRDVSLPLLRCQHQDRIPGCDGQESAAACQSQLTPVLRPSPTLYSPSEHLYSTAKLNKSTLSRVTTESVLCSGSLKFRTEFSAISNTTLNFLQFLWALKSPMHTKRGLICWVWLWSSAVRWEQGAWRILWMNCWWNLLLLYYLQRNNWNKMHTSWANTCSVWFWEKLCLCLESLDVIEKGTLICLKCTVCFIIIV